MSDVTASAGPGSLTSRVSVVNLGGANDQLPFADGLISEVALDSKTDTLYITTRPGTLPASTNTAGIYAYKISNGHLTTVWSEAVTSSTKALTDMTYITVDPATGDYYVSDSEESDTPGIYTGNVADIGVAPTLLLAVAPPQNGEASGDVTDALAIDDPPTVSGATVTAIDGNTGRTAGTVTAADVVTISVASARMSLSPERRRLR